MSKIVRLRLMTHHVMNEFLRRCGIRNMGLILSYLFSCDKCIDVVMDFIISTSFDLPPAMQSSTMTEEEDCSEWGKNIYDLATRHIKNKIIYSKSVNCHWRLEGIDWYYDDYYYKCIKYGNIG